MKYVLLFFWSYYDNPLAMHVTPDVITYTESECEKAGELWLRGAVEGEIQTRHSFACPKGDTAYMLAADTDED